MRAVDRHATTLKWGIAGICAMQIVPLSAVRAQESDDVVLPPTSPVLSIAGQEPKEAAAYVDNDGACKISMVPRDSEASALGCAFEDTSVGITLAEVFSVDDSSVEVETSFARATSGAFALDHIMRGYREGMNAETTLASMGVDASLFDGRLEWESKISWSRAWEVPVAASPMRPARISEETGTASEHRIKATLIEQPSLKLTVEGRYTRADEGYRPYYVTLPDRLFAAEGETARLDTRLDVGDWKLKAGTSTVDNPYFHNKRMSLSASRSGVTLRWSERSGASNLAFGGSSDRRSETASRTYGIDLSTFELAPMIAIEDEGIASLVPKTLTVELQTKTIDRFSAGNTSGFTSKGWSVFGLWTTPLGDTIVNFSTAKAEGTDYLGEPYRARESFMMLSHSFYLGDWTFDLDYVSNRDAERNLAAPSDSSDLASFGIGARYSAKGMPTIDLRIGRDTMDISSAEGALRLRDRSLRAEAEIDLTPWLQRKLERDDMQLKLEMQWDFDNSGYEFLLFDDVIDSEFTRTQGRGALLSFNMSF